MGNLLGGGSNNGNTMQIGGGGYGGQNSGNYGKGPELQCCDPVVDPISLLTTIAGIAGLSFFLRQAVIDIMLTGRRRALQHRFNFLSQGKHYTSPSSYFCHFQIWIIQLISIEFSSLKVVL